MRVRLREIEGWTERWSRGWPRTWRSEESEARLADQGTAESFSSPFFHLKTFDKNEGIWCMSGGDGPQERMATVFGCSVFPPGVLRGGKADVQARRKGGRTGQEERRTYRPGGKMS
jgi:hypothetical protein